MVRHSELAGVIKGVSALSMNLIKINTITPYACLARAMQCGGLVQKRLLIIRVNMVSVFIVYCLRCNNVIGNDIIMTKYEVPLLDLFTLSIMFLCLEYCPNMHLLPIWPLVPTFVLQVLRPASLFRFW